MIFGFNTDVQKNGATYHVQTEDRSPKSAVIDSMIYVRGIIVDRVSTPYDPREKTREEIETMVRTQHRGLVDSLRSGALAPAIPAEAASSSGGTGYADGKGYSVRLMNPHDLLRGNQLSFRLSVWSRGFGTAATGSLLDARWTPAQGDTQILMAQPHDGLVDLTVPLPPGPPRGILLISVHGPEGTEVVKFQISAT